MAGFGDGVSHLARYATHFDAVEINSSFHRPHRRQTYERWAASVPEGFRFAVKLPRTITHDGRLIGCTDLVESFAAEISGLGGKRGPLLVQLPPSLDFAPERVAVFFELLRNVAGGEIACEPRHPGWFGAPATDLLASAGVARVMADPLPAKVAQAEPVAAGTLLPGGGLRYVRLHGTPQIYRSPYGDAALATWRDRVASTASDESCWTIFDNTSDGAAVDDARRFAGLVHAAGR